MDMSLQPTKAADYRSRACPPFAPEPTMAWSRHSLGASMKIHEYQAKEILRKYGVAVPAGEMAISFEEADTAAKALFAAGHSVVVVKAQIHAGGRGKGG